MALNRFTCTATSKEVSPGNISITGNFFDSAAPAVILATEQFVFPRGTSQVAAQARIIERGQEIRDALATQTTLQALVSQTMTIP